MKSLPLQVFQNYIWILVLEIIAVSSQGLAADVTLTPQRFMGERMRGTEPLHRLSSLDGSCANIQAPKDVSCKQGKNSSIEVTWSAPSPSSTCHVLKYVVSSNMYVLWSQMPISNVTEVNATGTLNYVIHKPVAHTNYTFEIKAEASNGVLGEAGHCSVRTSDEVPSEPVNLRITAQTNASLSVAWKAPENENDIINYQVRWLTDGVEIGCDNTSAVSYTIGDLQPCTAYSVNVSACNAAGEGEAAETKGATKFKSPETATCSQDKTDMTLHVTWSDTECDISSYKISSITTVLWSQEEFSNTTSVGGSETAYVIENPEPLSFYSFAVQAMLDELLIGDPMQCNIVTRQIAPDQPKNLTLLGATSSSLSIQWEQPVQENGVIISYLVSWSIQDSSEGGKAEVAARRSILLYNYDITGLVSETDYSVQVQGNTGQVGEAAREVFTTRATDALVQQSSNLSTGAIVGIVIMAVIAILLLAATVMSFMKKDSVINRDPTSAPGPLQVNLTSGTQRTLKTSTISSARCAASRS